MTATRTKTRHTNQRKRNEDIASWHFNVELTYRDPGDRHRRTIEHLAPSLIAAHKLALTLCCWHNEPKVIIRELGQ